MDNMLNSILIEGNVTDTPTENIIDKLQYCCFKIKSFHVSYDNTKSCNVITTIIKIICAGKLAEMCFQYIKPGTCIRVVGRLVNDVNDVNDSIVVFAENIEAKPIKEIR
jgi:single-stranded DNA-binding protein